MNTTQHILVNGSWIDDPDHESTFSPKNPATGDAIGDVYPVSRLRTLKHIAEHAAEAAAMLNRIDPETIALFLEKHADLIDARRDVIADMAHAETGLARSPRLVETEMDRTIDQLRQAGACVRSRDWMSARIDTQHNLRSMYEPLGGGVLIIGPNNFPLAYNGAAGGDFAAAIASRNPVIAKAHPLHPGTSRLLAQCAHDAAVETGLPSGAFQFFYHCSNEDGLDLIRDANVSALGFTGSQGAGLAMKEAADETGTPVYLELSSINPVFVLPGAMQTRGDAIAEQIAESMLAGSGQQCTCPGLIVVRSGDDAERFIDSVCAHLTSAAPQAMLSHDGRDGLQDAIAHNIEHGARCIIGGNIVDDPGAKYEHTILRVDAKRFLSDANELQTEMFGVGAMVVVCDDAEQFERIAQTLDGQLTGTVHHEDADAGSLGRLERVLRTRVGRLIHNAVPTGVHVSPATVHGGPFPATGHPGFTAVGVPTSIHRFCALRCYDRVEQGSLPVELRDANPTGSMHRCIDGVWTTGDVGA